MSSDAKEYTYFLQAEDGGSIKIGHTTNVRQRLASLQIGSPKVLRLVGLLNNNSEIELHKQFRKHRSHGEWFDPCDELLDFIQNECSHDLDQYLSGTDLKLAGKAAKPNITKRFQIEISKNHSVHFEYCYDLSEGIDEIDLEDTLRTKDFWHEEDYEDIQVELGVPPAQDLSRTFEEECEDRLIHPECEFDVIAKILNYISYRNSGDGKYFESHDDFFEKLCINPTEGHFCILCAPVSSEHRFKMLKELAEIVAEMDEFTGAWRFFVLFDDCGKQTGIDLMHLSLHEIMKRRMTSVDPHFYVFDPKILVKTFEGVDK